MPRVRVLIYSLMPTQWKTMHQVARVLKAAPGYEPVVFFDRNAGNAPFERDLRACLADGIEALDEHGPIGEGRVGQSAAMPARPRAIAIRALHAVLGRTPAWYRVVEPLVAFPEHLAHYRERIAFVRGLCRRERIDVLVLPGDSVSYDTPAWIKAAHDLGIPSVIVPFSTNTPDGVAADLRLSREYDATRWLNRPVARLAPKWLHAGLVRVPAGQIAAMHALGLDPPQPWVLHSGAADAIVAESEHVRDQLAAQGLPADRIAVTGALGDDVLAGQLAHADERREALYRELGLPAGRPMILGSICDYRRYFELAGPQEGFASSADLIEAWVATMAEAGGHNVVLSLHPWLAPEDWRHLERPGVRIARRPIEELVPLCRFFVVSVSVTVRLAIVCGKPVVDHDVLHFRIRDYADAGGVSVVETREQLRGAVFRLARDHAAYDEAARAQAASAPLYGRLDGRSGERLIALIDQLRARRARAAAGSPSGSPSTAG